MRRRESWCTTALGTLVTLILFSLSSSDTFSLRGLQTQKRPVVLFHRENRESLGRSSATENNAERLIPPPELNSSIVFPTQVNETIESSPSPTFSPSTTPSFKPSFFPSETSSSNPTTPPTTSTPSSLPSRNSSSSSSNAIPPLQKFAVSAQMTLLGISELNTEAQSIWEDVTSIFFSQRIDANFGLSQELVNVVATAHISDKTKTSRNWFRQRRQLKGSMIPNKTRKNHEFDFRDGMYSLRKLQSTSPTTTLDALIISFTLDIQFRSIESNHDVVFYVQESVKTANDRTLYTLLLQDTQDPELMEVESIIVRFFGSTGIIDPPIGDPIETNEKNSYGAILGASFGGATAALLLIGLPLLIRRRRKTCRDSIPFAGLDPGQVSSSGSNKQPIQIIDPFSTIDSQLNKASEWGCESFDFENASVFSCNRKTTIELVNQSSPSIQAKPQEDATDLKTEERGNEEVSNDLKSLDLSRVSNKSQSFVSTIQQVDKDRSDLIDSTEDIEVELEKPYQSTHGNEHDEKERDDDEDQATNPDDIVSADDMTSIIDVINGGNGDDISIALSSLGAPLGTNQTIGSANLSQSYFTNESSIERLDRSEIIEVNVPHGVLGLVIDTVRGGIPTVHSIKGDSVLGGKVVVGDRLISVNNIDTTELTARNVSRLIANFKNADRRFIFVRQTCGRSGDSSSSEDMVDR